MIWKILAVRDSALNAYMQPYFTPHRNAGLRAFGDELRRTDSIIGKHPEDYELYEIGSYDDTTADIIPLAEPILVVRGKDLATTL